MQALKDVAIALRKTSWDFNADPCSGKPPWNVSHDDAVTCDCSYSYYNGDDVGCHVTSMYVSSHEPTDVT